MVKSMGIEVTIKGEEIMCDQDQKKEKEDANS